MTTTLLLDNPVSARPGDEFNFDARPGWLGSQYHVEVHGATSALEIGVWGPDNPNLGKARNKPGEAFVNRTLPKGTWRITVQNVGGPYEIVVTKRSLWNQWFGG